MEKPDINTLYYIFSTISQTLAGAIGLMGAFVLFKFQDINKQIEELLESQKHILYTYGIQKKEKFTLETQKNFNEIYDNIILRRFLEIIEKSDNYINNLKKESELESKYLSIYFTNILAFLTRLKKHKDRLMRWIWMSFIVTVVAIFYSVVALSLSTNIMQQAQTWTDFSWAIIAIDVLFVLFALITYIVIIVHSLDDIKIKSDNK